MSSSEHTEENPIAKLIDAVAHPSRVVVTAGMPYANGPLHLGHLAGAQLPADIYARFMGMLIGRENVLFVCGTDEHGSTSEVAALQAGVPVRELVDSVHDKQAKTLARYHIGLDVYAGTSRPEVFPIHKELSQEFLRKLHANGMLEKRTSKQWYDPKAERFLPDRLVRGKCPNPKCTNENAYSDECDVCGKQYEPTMLINPRSAVSDATPEMRDTTHWFLDMSKVQEELRVWIQSKQKKWRPSVVAAVLDLVMPSLRFDNTHEEAYKALKASLPKHKSKYAPGKKVMLVFETKADLERAVPLLTFPAEVVDDWAHRSITRDIAWGIPVPPELDPDLAGKTLYVWPDSLIAPISFSRVARPADGDAFWRDPKGRIVQFLGQDNVFFYVVMQGALWMGSKLGYELTDIVGCCHLLVNGEKMSKSKGNFFTGDELLDGFTRALSGSPEPTVVAGYSADQIRYYLATLDLSERPSDFDLKRLAERNDFLGGKLNAAFERPISLVHKQFGGIAPDGKLVDKVVDDTVRVVQRYLKSMERADTSNLLTEHIENYARTITGLIKKHNVHDDHTPVELRKDVLYTCLYVLRNLMILLYPFVPSTVERLRLSLNLPETVFKLSELGKPIPAGHALGEMRDYFPSTLDVEER